MVNRALVDLKVTPESRARDVVNAMAAMTVELKESNRSADRGNDTSRP